MTAGILLKVNNRLKFKYFMKIHTIVSFLEKKDTITKKEFYKTFKDKEKSDDFTYLLNTSCFTSKHFKDLLIKEPL